MTRRLEAVLAEVAKLPPEEQDAVAAWLLEELRSDRSWAQLFQESPGRLGDLADEALREHRAGRTQPLEPDRL